MSMKEKYDLIEVLESPDLGAINEMISAFKAGAKARYGVLHDTIVMEKGFFTTPSSWKKGFGRLMG